MAHAPTVMQLLPALNAGGVERSALEIGAALVRAGSPSLVVSAGGTMVAQLERDGSRHIALDIGRKSLLTLRHVATLRHLMETHRPAIVHARSRLPAWIAHLALRGLRGARPAFVTTVHGLNSPGRYSAIMARGERVICVSETVRRYVLKHYPQTDESRLRVIPRGIDPDAFPFGHVAGAAWRARFEQAHPALRGGKLLVLPGRGTRLKGHAEAVHLLADLRSRGVDARLLLLGAREAGRDNYVRELERLAAGRHVAAHLVISEMRSDVRDVLAAADLVLQLSTRPESFGRTVAEALSLGRPVLGFDHGGVGEILAAHFPAGAVQPGDRGALAQRAAELLAAAAPLARYSGPTLEDMQRATLAVYAELAR